MLSRPVRHPRAAEHAGEFVDASIPIERLERGARHAALRALDDTHLMTRLGRHLRQVRHAQDLT